MRSNSELYRILSIAAVLELFAVDKSADIMCDNHVSLLDFVVSTSFIGYCPFVVISVNVRSIGTLYISNSYVKDERSADELLLYLIL